MNMSYFAYCYYFLFSSISFFDIVLLWPSLAALWIFLPHPKTRLQAYSTTLGYLYILLLPRNAGVILNGADLNICL